MTLLTLQQLNVEDSLMLSFDGFFAGQSTLERELEPLLHALEAYAGGWMPNLVKGKRRRNYSRAAVWKALEETRDQYGSIIGLHHTTSPAAAMTLSLWLARERSKLSIGLYVQPLSFFAQVECCDKLVDMVRVWASLYPPPYALAHSMADRDLADFPNFGRDDETTRRDGFDKVYELCWLNVFGPRLVETVGRERMLSTPAWRVEELPNGCVLLVTWPSAADFASDEARQAQARALVHLRPELDLDTVLHTLRGRSAALAPVKPHFHQDVAPLLSRVVDDFAISERQRRIAEFNAYQPPEPEEWLPADAALPSDVTEPERAREHYGYLAERLVALLHTKLPSVFAGTPESLTDVDYQFWHEDFPSVFEREHIDAHAVPAIGAYLGEVLVRNLGGRWIPRQKLEESQVLVGHRVWLPFVRAWRYMRSRQSLLDASLSQLYRVAERHQDSDTGINPL